MLVKVSEIQQAPEETVLTLTSKTSD